MAKLKLVSAPAECSDLVIAGWGGYGHITCTDEIKRHNRSKRDMAAANATFVLGELLEVGEAVDFSGAPTGKGYFRDFDMVVDMSDFEGSWKGGTGSVSFDQKFKFKMGGLSTAKMEWILSVMSCCGLMLIVPDKEGTLWELGNKLNPSIMEAAKITNKKDDKSIEGEIKVSYPPRKYDAVAFPLDTVPN